ncbi:Aluminum-activated malate transporter 13 [Linum grandiflorum]
MVRMESSSAVVDINDNVMTKGKMMEEEEEAAENGGGGGGMKTVRKWVHSGKVGVAVVVVSLLYFLDPLYKEVGDDNAIWAIMTVVVIFEFHAGATVSKGVNRIIGTVLGGGFGCLVATTGQKVGGIGNSIIVGVSVFAVAGGATYYRQIQRKKLFDYGANIFILTFSLVAVSGLRIENVIEIARERLLMILLGFMTCVLTSLFFFPIWASDDLHSSFSSRFHQLAASLQGCVEEYFRMEEKSDDDDESKQQPVIDECFKTCEAVLLAKSKDDSLVISARWEPWHGKFGLSYPWDRYNKTAQILSDLAASILSLKFCLKSPRQEQISNRESIKEPCEAAAASLAWTLGELGDSIRRMRRCNTEASIVPELKSARLELSRVIVTTPFNATDAEALGMATFVFRLTEMVEVLEELAKQVEELGQTAGFHET